MTDAEFVREIAQPLTGDAKEALSGLDRAAKLASDWLIDQMARF